MTATSKQWRSKNGLDVRDVVDALNAAAFGPAAETDENASNYQ